MRQSGAAAADALLWKKCVVAKKKPIEIVWPKFGGTTDWQKCRKM